MTEQRHLVMFTTTFQYEGCRKVGRAPKFGRQRWEVEGKPQQQIEYLRRGRVSSRGGGSLDDVRRTESVPPPHPFPLLEASTMLVSWSRLT